MSSNYALLDEPAQWSAFSTPSPENKNADQTRGLWQSQVVVEGMHCGSCALNVEKALRSVPGVKQATVNGGTHRGFAATFASARPSCRLSNRHNSSDNISAVIEIPLQQIKSFKAEQEGAFI